MNTSFKKALTISAATRECESLLEEAVLLLSAKLKVNDSELRIARYLGYLQPEEMREKFSMKMAKQLKKLVLNLHLNTKKIVRAKDEGMETLRSRWTAELSRASELSESEMKTFIVEAMAVGRNANQEGGIMRMHEVFNSVPERLMQILLESIWSGIGEWRSPYDRKS
ncbi:MAG: hypothetical protein EOP04_01590 [Proteobacteria bacterium]|nr:MAG: hypothetical protein EOP04_01590 [Pseudomonadota bacterium]